MDWTTLKDKVAIISGASGGIGRATALRMAAEGAKVVLSARSGHKLDEVAEKVREAGGEALAVPADWREDGAIGRVFDETQKAYGRLDVLVNNAGRGIYDTVLQGKPEDWRVMLDLNVYGLVYATQRALQAMVPQKGGHIVNISSVSGRTTAPGWAVYNASKWAVVGFSDALRKEVLGDGIRVTCIEPGAVDTEWGENMPDAFEQFRESVDMVTSDDVAAAVLYALHQPQNVSVNELLIRPTKQER